ncbi:MAG: Cof-type HAD-IIB family hydrolase [Clostridia bacterium]|nr:Cof-type HAD-IIB family hydrolase [Clostridia bacterium]
MAIRLAFFDIDGTLLPFGAEELSPGVRAALQALRRRGIGVFAATGRPPYLVPRFRGLNWDGLICFNGGYCRDGDRVVFARPIEKEDVRRVTANAKAMGLPVNLAAGDRMGCNFHQPELDEFIGFARRPAEVPEDFDGLMEEDIFQIMVAVRRDQEERLFRGTKGVKAERWWPKAIDVVPSACSKAEGVRRILEGRSLQAEDCIAFGDGGNDVDMIRCAGIGVAMGNARDDVKAAADYVTLDAAQDGVAVALVHLGLV